MHMHARTPPLSDRGRAETRRTAAALRELDTERMLTSPLPRARETAQILAAELAVPLDEPVSAAAGMASTRLRPRARTY